MTTAEEYYELIMNRVCHVLGQRIRGEISYCLLDDCRGFIVVITNDTFFITFKSEILYTDIESCNNESNKCVLHLADRTIREYKEYIERTIMYKENSI